MGNCGGSKWPRKRNPDFSNTESDQILTTSVDGYPSRSDFSVLIDFNGNVLTQAEGV
jgi:hypothetical protein